jgi:hypothetical protein
MKRRLFLAALPALLVATPGAARAAPVDDVVAALQAQGFGSIDVTQTLLGRIRILASAGGRQREVIINPRTGEILRDVWLSTDYAEDTSGGSSRPSGSSGHGGGDDDDDDDDDDDNSGHGGGDDDDDDDDDDHSGHGGGDDDDD